MFKKILVATFSVFLIFGVIAVRSYFVAFADDSSSTDQSQGSDTGTNDSSTISNPPPQDNSDADSSSTQVDASSTDGTDDGSNASTTVTNATSSDSGTDASSTDGSDTDVSSTPTSTDTTDDAVISGGGGDTDTSSTDADSSSTDPNASSTDGSTNDAGTAVGNGTPTGTDGTDVSTGNAGSVVDLSNVINTNIVSSQGFIDFLNLFSPFFGNIDLSNLLLSDSSCSFCGTGLTVTNDNTGTISNDITVDAGTGSNSIDGGGTSTITTGDAFAAANVVNIANTNIVGSNYLLLVLNNFSEMDGDLVLPGASFFQNLFGDGSSGNTSITNNNSADISNNVSATADTGDNSSSGSGGSSITTGSSTAVSNVVNDVNTNDTGSTQVYVLVRVFGDWDGSIFSTPAGLSWEQTPDGLLLEGADTGSIIDGTSTDCGCDTGSATITNNNSATIQNNVQVYALTGDNEITNSSSSSISTGSATAVANVVNIANTNIVGQNILLAIINIFGNWNGNIAFGQPDLWVGTQADVSSNPLTPSSTITYNITVTNNGSAPATDVQVQTSDDQQGVASITDPGGGSVSGNSDIWNIPTIAPGGTQSFSYTETLADEFPFYGMGELTENVNATEHEDDANPADNSDSISFPLEGATGGAMSPSSLWVRDLNSATSTVQAGSLVRYRLVVGNQGGGAANNVYLHETLYDPYGVTISTSTWALGQIDSGGEMIVDYETDFGQNASSGDYISYASIDGTDVTGNIWHTKNTISSSTVDVVNADDDNTPPPPPTIVYVPATSTTETTTTVGADHDNIKITNLPSSAPKPNVNIFSKAGGSSIELAEGASCAATAGPTSTTTGGITTQITSKINLTASLGNLFADNNATSIGSFLTSTALVLGGPFFRMW